MQLIVMELTEALWMSVSWQATGTQLCHLTSLAEHGLEDWLHINRDERLMDWVLHT